MLVNYSSSAIEDSVVKSVRNSWPGGISKIKVKTAFNCEVTELKLNGYPWHSTSDESVNSRKLLGQIIQNLSQIRWKFMAAVNIHGTTDSLFFQYSPNQV